MKDKYVGTIVNNQYEILEKLPYKYKDGHSLYKARCILCGYERISVIAQLNHGTKCEYHYVVKARWYSKRLRNIFKQMKDRCLKTSNKSYCRYGGRGINVCDEWLNNPQLFNDWSISNGYNDTLTIDRINNDLGYCKSNCRWVSKEFNSKWKSTTNSITVDNISDSCRGWSKRLGVGKNFILRYLRNNGYEKCVGYIKSLLQNTVYQQ